MQERRDKSHAGELAIRLPHQLHFTVLVQTQLILVVSGVELPVGRLEPASGDVVYLRGEDTLSYNNALCTYSKHLLRTVLEWNPPNTVEPPKCGHIWDLF